MGESGDYGDPGLQGELINDNEFELPPVHYATKGPKGLKGTIGYQGDRGRKGERGERGPQVILIFQLQT